MTRPSYYTHIIIGISIFLALIAQSIPWPDSIDMFRPNWVVLVICYWSMALPHRVNVGTALLTGLIWDLVNGSVLGVHGLAMSVVAYVIAVNFQLLRNMAIWHQALVVTALSAMVREVEFWGQFTQNGVSFDSLYLLGSIVNLLLWPWIFFLLRRIRRVWQMS